MKSIKTLMAIIVIAGLFMAVGCEKKNLPDVGGTAVQNVSNEWRVAISKNGQLITTDRIPMWTYNSAQNVANHFIIDNSRGTGAIKFRTESNVDISTLSFSVKVSANLLRPTDSLTITEGKIMLNAAITPLMQMTVDSIYYKVVLASDPTSTYIVSGIGFSKYDDDF